MKKFNFKINNEDGLARLGTISTNRGNILTPAIYFLLCFEIKNRLFLALGVYLFQEFYSLNKLDVSQETVFNYDIPVTVNNV